MHPGHGEACLIGWSLCSTIYAKTVTSIGSTIAKLTYLCPGKPYLHHSPAILTQATSNSNLA